MDLIDEVKLLPTITTLTYGQRLNGGNAVQGQWHFLSSARPATLTTGVGIYFLASNRRIYKVGKATGQDGMQGRIRKYETYYRQGQTDKSVICWFQQMQGTGDRTAKTAPRDVRVSGAS